MAVSSPEDFNDYPVCLFHIHLSKEIIEGKLYPVRRCDESDVPQTDWRAILLPRRDYYALTGNGTMDFIVGGLASGRMVRILSAVTHIRASALLQKLDERSSAH